MIPAPPILMRMKPLLSPGRAGLRRAAPAVLLCALLQSATFAGNTGLWVGSAVVDQVNQPAIAPTNLMPAKAFSYRLILHVDSTNQARLLQRVLAVFIPDAGVVTNAVTGLPATNGTYVLLSDESSVPAQLQAHPTASVKRVSSVNFPLMAPQFMNGQFGSTGQLTCTLQLPYNDPVNPFVHVYAPLHDNRRVENGVTTLLPEGVESFSVTRNLTLRFAAQDPDNASNPNWGIDEVGGTLQEVVDGLYQPLVRGLPQSIQARGSFRLRKASDVGTLITP